jgi:hypothetical protein
LFFCGFPLMEYGKLSLPPPGWPGNMILWFEPLKQIGLLVWAINTWLHIWIFRVRQKNKNYCFFLSLSSHFVV